VGVTQQSAARLIDQAHGLIRSDGDHAGAHHIEIQARGILFLAQRVFNRLLRADVVDDDQQRRLRWSFVRPAGTRSPFSVRSVWPRNRACAALAQHDVDDFAFRILEKRLEAPRKTL
jgi:hypothetical protein